MEKSTEKQAFLIYYEIYGDKLNKQTNKYEATPSQEILRETMKRENGWGGLENKFHLVDKIQNRLTKKQAVYVIDLLKKKKNYKLVEEILTKKYEEI